MKRSRFSEAQVAGILREREARERTADACRRHGVSEAASYRRKSKDGGMQVSDIKRLKEFETENTRLKTRLADVMLTGLN